MRVMSKVIRLSEIKRRKSNLIDSTMNNMEREFRAIHGENAVMIVKDETNTRNWTFQWSAARGYRICG